jgi:HSP20 family protein
MNIVRYDPWHTMQQLQREMSSIFDRRFIEDDASLPVASSDWAPAVDIKEEDKRFLIQADIPGVDPEDIEVQMENGVLTISGKRQAEHEDEKEGYKRIERSFGSFVRRFTLPESADPENIKAKSKNGALEIVVEKREAPTLSRRISVEK